MPEMVETATGVELSTAAAGAEQRPLPAGINDSAIQQKQADVLPDGG